jgi:ATPase subunit of ABC transporter with duplicated ATPase domains
MLIFWVYAYLFIPSMAVADEVPSHLDLLSIEALTICLQKYNGAVVLVSHDQHFVSEVANKVQNH